MKTIQEIFNNREISLLIWLLVFFILMISKRQTRKAIWDIFKMLFNKHFLKVYPFIIIYLAIMLVIVIKINLWNITDIKDSVFWLFTVAAVMIFRINSTKSIDDFKKLFFETIKLTIIVEFIVNLFSFSLITELILFPLITFTILLQVVSESDKKNNKVTKLLTNFLSLIVLLILTFSIYKTYIEFNNIANAKTLKTFILPVVLTLLFIPFTYLLSLYSIYETFFVHLELMTVKKQKVKVIKKIILRVANINLRKLNNIKAQFNKRVFYDDTNLEKYIKRISKITNQE